jgi:hypothetical protein
LSADCKHENFNVRADVNRLLANEGDVDPSAFLMELTVWCRDCNLPFEFIGCPAGMLHDRPAVSVDNQTLRAPVRPKGAPPSLHHLPGFVVRRAM